MDIINQKDETIEILRNMLDNRDEEIRKSEEKNLRLSKEKFIIEACRDISVNELKEVLAEQYKIIDELITKYKYLEEFIASNNKFLDNLIGKANNG